MEAHLEYKDFVSEYFKYQIVLVTNILLAHEL